MSSSLVAGASQTNLSEEIGRRFMIGIFAFLSWACLRVVIAPPIEGHIMLMLLALFEIPVMVITWLLFGRRNITHDINEIHFYALLIHLVYLPAYMQGVPAVYHNVAIRVLLCLIVVRLLYVGPRTADGDFQGLPVFGLLGHVRQILEARQQSKNVAFFKYWPHILFFGSVLPLWAVMMRSNDSLTAAVVACLMLFVFLIANNLQIALATFRNRNKSLCLRIQALELENSSLRAHSVESSNDLIKPSVRDVAAQLVDSYKRTHPSMQNLNVVIAKYVERNFPDESTFQPSSISARRAKAATQLAELILIAKDQLSRNAQSGNTHDDIARLTAKFDESLQFRLDETGMIAFMDYVMGQPPLEVSDTTFLLACDVLTTGWMRCLLSVDAASFQEEYSRLELMTREFVARFMPYDESLENE